MSLCFCLTSTTLSPIGSRQLQICLQASFAHAHQIVQHGTAAVCSHLLLATARSDCMRQMYRQVQLAESAIQP